MLRALLAPALVTPAETLRGWRHSLLDGLSAVAGVLGLLVCVPSIWLSLRHQLWSLVAADVVALGAVFILCRRRDIAYRWRAGILVGAGYLVAVALLFSVGAMTQIYLAAVPVLCTVLLGSRAALVAILVCTTTLFLVGLFGHIELGIAGGTDNPLLHWSILSINYLLVATVLVVPCNYLLHGLDGALARQRAVHEKLAAQIEMLQQSMAAQRAAEESNEQKSEFLAMISHEVRTPLGGVIGMLRLAQKDAGLAPDTRNKLRTSLNNAEVLLQIINDILDFSRLEAGKMPIEAIDFDLPALLRDVHCLLSDRAETKGVSLVVDIDPTLPQWWHGDPTRLRQVVLNLVGNGIKFTERGEVRLLAAASNSGLRLTVRDTGIGIAADAMHRLFSMFEQASAATSRKYGGTGLGLAICKNIVNAMGGRIDVRSELGAGSVFRVHLPLSLGQPVPDRQQELARPHARHLRILCAEDGATNQVILHELLSGMGHAVQIEEDGLAALHALAQRDYDLLILDSRMPRMDGLTALRQLRAGAAGVRQPGLPVLALTANATPEERARFLAAGANGFLPKPIDEASLHAEIGRQIGLAALDDMFGVRHVPDGAADVARNAFLREAPRLLAALRAALAAGDADAVALHAHSMLGGAGYFDADTLRTLCRRIEQQADTGHLAGIDAMLQTLDEELAALLAQLA